MSAAIAKSVAANAEHRLFEIRQLVDTVNAMAKKQMTETEYPEVLEVTAGILMHVHQVEMDLGEILQAAKVDGSHPPEAAQESLAQARDLAQQVLHHATLLTRELKSVDEPDETPKEAR